MITKTTLKDTYALITGGSEGLGKEFAVQLTELGMNVVLVARNETSLNETAAFLRAQSAQKVEVLAADLTDPASFSKIEVFLKTKSIQIKLLVNNAGTGYWGPLEKATPQDLSKMIDLNIKAPVLLSQILFRDPAKQSGSVIINVASLAALQPVPYMAVYSATKSFMTNFSMALWKEWEKHGLYVQTLMPGAIETKFDEKSGGFKAPFKKDSAEYIVKLSLSALLKGRAPIVYAKKSFMQRLFTKIMPLPFLVGEVGKVFSKDLVSKRD